MSTPLPDKKFFKIGEVAALVGVKAHVLRYWESELGVLRPLKTRGAHRMYRREDVEILGEVRKLLQEDGLTLAAAKRRFAKARAPDAPVTVTRDASAPVTPDAPVTRDASAPVSTAARALALRAELLQVRNDLAALLAQLDAPPAPPPSSRVATATVTAVVPKTILMQRSSELRRPR